ncbi:MAG: 50S ribosomal protein L33 [Gammaproteobacteria bacterium]|jgi:large subunit ribosomal protein L33
MSKKRKTIIVKLASTASKYFYTTRKNPKMTGGFQESGKLKLMKYDPVIRKHVWFEEKKIGK